MPTSNLILSSHSSVIITGKGVPVMTKSDRLRVQRGDIPKLVTVSPPEECAEVLRKLRAKHELEKFFDKFTARAH